MGDPDRADDSEGWEDGRAHNVQQAPRAAAQRVATANGGAAVSAGAALDLGMAVPGSGWDGGPADGRRAAAHGSMAADFEAGAPVVYVNDNPLIGWDAVEMQRRMEEEQQPMQQAMLEERLAVEEEERQAVAAEVAVRRAEAVWRRAEAESRLRKLQASRQAMQPSRGVTDAVNAEAYRLAGSSSGKRHPQQETYAAAGWPERQLKGLHAEREPIGQRWGGGTSARVVIPEDWGDDEPMAVDYQNDYAEPAGGRGSACRKRHGAAGAGPGWLGCGAARRKGPKCANPRPRVPEQQLRRRKPRRACAQAA